MSGTTIQKSNTTTTLLPDRPRLVLRLGFVGRRELPEDETRNLEAALIQVYETIGRRLATIVPSAPVRSEREFRVAEFYSKECPLLRVVTGLCEGADALAANVLARVAVAPDRNGDLNQAEATSAKDETRCLETELAAVLPFDVATYRRSRPDWFLPEFDRQLQACQWVIELDGIYEEPDPPTALADNRRARGYRAQSAFLLRQCDILIAAADPDDKGKAGGTRETVREALAFELPIVFLHVGNGGVYLIEPSENMHSVLAEPPLDETARSERLTTWVDQLTADPDRITPPEHHAKDIHENGEHVLNEFFSASQTPPTSADGERVSTWREWIWSKVEKPFRTGLPAKSDPPLAPYEAFRQRSTSLNYHYSGLYRGAFLLNYGLAIVAVVLAAVSLVFLGTASHTSVGRDIAILLEQAGHHPQDVAVSPLPRPWLLPALLALAFGKLLILMLIARNTRRANREKWNDRAVDYRYLAERLRSMFYLPQAGSFQPPAATPPQFASRVARQSSVDWLFDAIVRAVSPAELDSAREAHIETTGNAALTVRKLVRINPVETVRRVRDSWISEQANYHERNWMTMNAFNHWLERAARRLGLIVVGVVFIDLLLIVGKVAHWFPHDWVPLVRTATPWLIFVSAVLPAVVAALSGIRSQSECERLSERSAVMRTLLRGRVEKHTQSNAPTPAPQGRYALADSLIRRMETATSDPATNVGSWSHDALRLTERIATDFVQEAAEWTVLYAKEVSDPG